MSISAYPDSIVFEGEEWRKIPLYPKCYVTRKGRVAGYWTGKLVERSYQKLVTEKSNRREDDSSDYVFVTMPHKKAEINEPQLECIG